MVAEFTPEQLDAMEGSSLPSFVSPAAQEFTPQQLDALDTSSEALRVGSQGVKGLGSLFDFVDQISPIRPEKFVTSSPADIFNPVGLGMPSLFGLTDYVSKKLGFAPQKNIADLITGNTPQPLASASSLLKNELSGAGLYTEAKPQTEIGKLAGSALEEGAQGAIGGPAGVAIAALAGGPGAYLAEKGLTGAQLPFFGPLSADAAHAIGSAGSQLGLSGVLGLASKAARLVGPVTGAGRDAAIRNIIENASVDSPSVMTSLERTAANPVSPFVTTAETTGDPGLARLEDTVRNRFMNSPIEAANAERAANRAGNLGTLFDPTANQYDTSKALEGAIAQSGKNISSVERGLWDQVPTETEIDASNAPGLLNSAVEKFHVELPNAPGPIKSLVSKISDRVANAADEPVTLGLIQDWKSQIGRLGRGSTEPSVRSTYEAMGNALNSVLDSNVSAGSLEPAAASALTEARTGTAYKYQMLGGTPELSIASGLKEGQILDDKFIKEVLRSPDEFTRVLTATQAGGVDAIPTLRQALMASITHDAKSGLEIGQSKWAANFAARKQQFEQVFAPEELDLIQQQIDDLASQTSVQSQAMKAGNSATNRRGEAGKVIDNAMGVLSPGFADNLGKVAPVLGAVAGYSHGPLATVASTLGSVIASNLAKKALGPAQRAFESRLIDAVQNPAVAREILAGSRPALDAIGNSVAPLFGSGIRTSLQNNLPTSYLPSSAMVNDTKNVGITPVAPELIKAVRQSNLPDDPVLDGIPLSHILDGIRQVESSGGKNLVSPKGALGPYQFMPATAKDLGLGNPMDEAASRAAAAKYILQLYKQTGSLQDALAAYNFGARALREGKAGIRTIPTETQQYPGKVLAAIAALNGVG